MLLLIRLVDAFFALKVTVLLPIGKGLKPAKNQRFLEKSYNLRGLFPNLIFTLFP